jgi:hypothetical protein
VKNIQQVFLRQQECAALLDILEGTAVNGEVFDFRSEFLLRRKPAGSWRLIAHQQGIVGNSFMRITEVGRLVLDGIEVGIEQSAFPVENEAVVILVAMPHSGSRRTKAAKAPEVQ